MSRQYPIIFSGSMVRAIIAGHKSQTRRLVTNTHLTTYDLMKYSQSTLETSPYGRVGDMLWVKEVWRVSVRFDQLKPSNIPTDSQVEYQADSSSSTLNSGKWRTPLFMPNRLSRLKLKITSIRIEPLCKCSEEDAKDEGMIALEGQQTSYRDIYKGTWENLHGKGSWESNPLIWVISFDIHKVL